LIRVYFVIIPFWSMLQHAYFAIAGANVAAQLDDVGTGILGIPRSYWFIIVIKVSLLFVLWGIISPELHIGFEVGYGIGIIGHDDEGVGTFDGVGDGFGVGVGADGPGDGTDGAGDGTDGAGDGADGFGVGVGADGVGADGFGVGVGADGAGVGFTVGAGVGFTVGAGVGFGVGAGAGVGTGVGAGVDDPIGGEFFVHQSALVALQL
jgi:hypothetical protein